MKIIRIVFIFTIMMALFGATVGITQEVQSYQNDETSEFRVDTTDNPESITCFLVGEQVSGMNKICYYDCLGSKAAITVSAVSLCPLSIQR